MISATLDDWVDLKLGFPFRSADFVESGVRLLRGDNIAQGELRWDNCAHWATPEPDGYLLRVGDVVLAMDRPWIGAGLKFARVTHADTPALLVQRVAALRAKPGMDQRFLEYVLRDVRFSAFVQSVQTGTAVPHISGGQIAAYRFDMPSLPVQVAIAEVLGALDDKIAANRALVDTADALAVCEVEDAARGSSLTPLRDLAEVVMGSSPPGESYNEREEGIPFFQGVRDFDTRTPRRRVWTTQPVREASAGDLLVSVRAPVGRANIAEETCCIGRGLAAIRSRAGEQATLFYQLRLADWAPFEAEGTIFGSISGPQLGSVLIPNLSSPVDVESRVAALEGVIRSLLRESRTLAELRDTLLPQLMSGKLRVRDAERAVEDVL